MKAYRLDEKLILRPLIKDMAEDLFTLIDNNRGYLRSHLSWLDDVGK